MGGADFRAPNSGAAHSDPGKALPFPKARHRKRERREGLAPRQCQAIRTAAVSRLRYRFAPMHHASHSYCITVYFRRKTLFLFPGRFFSALVGSAGDEGGVYRIRDTGGGAGLTQGAAPGRIGFRRWPNLLPAGTRKAPNALVPARGPGGVPPYRPLPSQGHVCRRFSSSPCSPSRPWFQTSSSFLTTEITEDTEKAGSIPAGPILIRASNRIRTGPLLVTPAQSLPSTRSRAGVQGSRSAHGFPLSREGQAAALFGGTVIVLKALSR